ncbi:MAG: DUF4248 domain-containing protein [Porphyromonas sp.]|nr:DUF4248 domain-containing protein [Porphyromonas sp.]
MANTSNLVHIPLERGYMYTFRSVAMRYYPHLKPETASRYFRRLINSDPMLLRGLMLRCYRPRQRSLTPRQIEYLIEELGEPKEFYEITIGR